LEQCGLVACGLELPLIGSKFLDANNTNYAPAVAKAA